MRGARVGRARVQVAARVEDDEAGNRGRVTERGGVEGGLAAVLAEELLAEEVRRGALELPVDTHTMAYARVRVVESFLYADAIAGETLELEKAVAILKLMLR